MTEIPPPFTPVGFAWRRLTLKEKGINRLRVTSAEELLGAGGAMIDATGRSQLAGGGFLITTQATRAQHTFETVIAAARMGRGVQAAMLNRALLEDVLDIHWTAKHPDEALCARLVFESVWPYACPRPLHVKAFPSSRTHRSSRTA